MGIFEILIENYDYNPITGVFVRIKKSRNACVGQINKPNKDGYIRLPIKGKSIYAHKLAILYMTGLYPSEVDHKNHIRSDNKYLNLREVTSSENMKNKSKYKNNTSGFNGVCFEPKRNKYKAYISVLGKVKNLGRFDTAKEAHVAVVKSAIANGYHINHGK